MTARQPELRLGPRPVQQGLVLTWPWTTWWMCQGWRCGTGADMNQSGCRYLSDKGSGPS